MEGKQKEGEDQVGALNQQLANLVAQKDRLAAKMKEMEKQSDCQVSDLNQQLTKMVADKDRLGYMIKENEVEKKKSDDQVVDLNQKLTDVIAERERLDTAIKKMEINQKRSDCKVGDLNQQLNNMVAEKDRLDAKIKEMEGKQKKGEDQVGVLNQQLANLVAQKDRLAAKMKEVETKLNKSESHATELTEKVHTLEERKEEMMAELGGLTTQVALKDQHLHSMAKEQDELKTKVALKDQYLTKMEVNKETSDGKARQLTQRLDNMVAEKSRSDTRIKDMRLEQNKSQTKMLRRSRLSKLIRNARCVREGSPSIYTPTLEAEGHPNDQIRKCFLGESSGHQIEKVILMVGATGSGKTTIINGMVNYILGVEWEDDFRFKLIVEDDLEQSQNQALNQTSYVTSYTLYHQEGFRVPYTVTIIDTPGFGDTSAIDRERHTTRQIKSFFSDMSGIDHLDAVCIVAQSSLPGLTPTLKYIFDQMLFLFGNDIKNSIFWLFTFADAQKPQVISGIDEAKLPFNPDKTFKFNNSALFINNHSGKGGVLTSSDSESSDEDANIVFDKMFWDMGVDSFKKFLNKLSLQSSLSLCLTKTVLEEREKIERHIIRIQREIKLGLTKLVTLRQEIQILKTQQADIDNNKDFTYVVSEVRFEKEELPVGCHVTNCLNCNFTCHDNCMYVDDDEKKYCCVMSGPGPHCSECSEKCHWTQHKNMRYKIIYTTVPVTKQSRDLLKRYTEAGEKKLGVKNTIKGAFNEFALLQITLLNYTDEVRKSLARLGEIALRPNPLSHIDYIDILIQSETDCGGDGWKERVAQLQGVRKQAECLRSVTDSNFDPFKDYLDQIVKNGFESVRDDIQSILDESLRENETYGTGNAKGRIVHTLKKSWYLLQKTFSR